MAACYLSQELITAQGRGELSAIASFMCAVDTGLGVKQTAEGMVTTTRMNTSILRYAVRGTTSAFARDLFTHHIFIQNRTSFHEYVLDEETAVSETFKEPAIVQ
jgi:hypothetical protein